MKLLSLLFILPLAALADSSDYVNFIRQIQQDNGVEWDLTIAPTGEAVSPSGVSEDGSHFELWSIHNTTAFEYLLDEQFVTSYTPNGLIEIITNDPYEPVPRTRVDQPFRVRVTVNGLLDSTDPTYPTAPDAAKFVDYKHATFSYPDGEHSLENVADPVGLLIEEGEISGNSVSHVTFGGTNLTGPDLTLVEGEEVFTVSARADFGVSATVLDSQRVQVWPIAQAQLSGYSSTAHYQEVPPVTLRLYELYPSSTTYLRIYPGPPQDSPTNAVIASDSVVVIEDSIPQDRTLVLKNLDRLFTEEGPHTVEVLHETPFGVDILRSGSISVDRTVIIAGSLYGQER